MVTIDVFSIFCFFNRNPNLGKESVSQFSVQSQNQNNRRYHTHEYFVLYFLLRNFKISILILVLIERQLLSLILWARQGLQLLSDKDLLIICQATMCTHSTSINAQWTCKVCRQNLIDRLSFRFYIKQAFLISGEVLHFNYNTTSTQLLSPNSVCICNLV